MAKKKYKVKPGQTPSQIAKQFNLTPQALLRANPGVTDFSAGMGISIPQAITNEQLRAYGYQFTQGFRPPSVHVTTTGNFDVPKPKPISFAPGSPQDFHQQALALSYNSGQTTASPRSSVKTRMGVTYAGAQELYVRLEEALTNGDTIPYGQAAALGIVKDLVDAGYVRDSNGMLVPGGQQNNNGTVQLDDNAYRVGKNFGATGDKWKVIYSNGSKVTVATGRNRRAKKGYKGTEKQQRKAQQTDQNNQGAPAEDVSGTGLVNYNFDWRT